MPKVILGITMSVDGYINDCNGSLSPLFSDIFGSDGQKNSKDSAILKEAELVTGAVIMGNNTYLLADDVDAYADNYEFQVPIFVLTHHIPIKHPKENDNLKINFVTEGIEKAVALAKDSVTGNKDVFIIGGAQTAIQAIKKDVIDEIHIDIMPFIFGCGLRLFEDGLTNVKLKKIQVDETEERVSIKYKILK